MEYGNKHTKKQINDRIRDLKQTLERLECGWMKNRYDKAWLNFELDMILSELEALEPLMDHTIEVITHS